MICRTSPLADSHPPSLGTHRQPPKVMGPDLRTRYGCQERGERHFQSSAPPVQGGPSSPQQNLFPAALCARVPHRRPFEGWGAPPGRGTALSFLFLRKSLRGLFHRKALQCTVSNPYRNKPELAQQRNTPTKLYSGPEQLQHHKHRLEQKQLWAEEPLTWTSLLCSRRSMPPPSCQLPTFLRPLPAQPPL